MNLRHTPQRLHTFLTKLARGYYLRQSQGTHSNLLTKYFRKWCSNEEVVVNTRGGFRMAVSPRDYISHRIYFFGEYDGEMSGVISHYLREGQTVWDIGAERGWFTLLMANIVGSTGRVDAFEAFPPNVGKLKANVDLNRMDWANVNGVAVSNAVGKMWFEPPSNEVTSKFACLQHCGGVGYLTDKQEPGSVEVNTITLDDYAAQNHVENLSFIKMDIEGAEVAALRGARGVIERWQPIIAVEYNQGTARRANTSIEELDALLDSYGYDRFIMRSHFVKLDSAELNKRATAESVFNVYCFPRPKTV